MQASYQQLSLGGYQMNKIIEYILLHEAKGNYIVFTQLCAMRTVRTNQ